MFANTIANWSRELDIRWPVRKLNFDDIPIEIRVAEPARVGIDRLLAALDWRPEHDDIDTIVGDALAWGRKLSERQP